MQLLASFVGKNRDFRAWLAAGMPANVVSLAEYREKRKTATQVYQMGLLEARRLSSYVR